jgi:hypothetical protein
MKGQVHGVNYRSSISHIDLKVNNPSETAMSNSENAINTIPLFGQCDGFYMGFVYSEYVGSRKEGFKISTSYFLLLPLR